jgi:hypothetical protein
MCYQWACNPVSSLNSPSTLSYGVLSTFSGHSNSCGQAVGQDTSLIGPTHANTNECDPREIYFLLLRVIIREKSGGKNNFNEYQLLTKVSISRAFVGWLCSKQAKCCWLCIMGFSPEIARRYVANERRWALRSRFNEYLCRLRQWLAPSLYLTFLC